MSVKNILISNPQYNTLFKTNINNELNIQKLWKKSHESKIFYNASKNPTIVLKVRNLNNVDFYSISSELKAFGALGNRCPNVVKMIKSFICDQNSNSYETNKNGIISLCRKFSNKKCIPLSILALEYIKGSSLNDIALSIEEFKDFIIQLFCVFYHLAAFKMEIFDTNLDNIIYVNEEENLDYTYLFGKNGIINVKHKIYIIDLDHVRFNIRTVPNPKVLLKYIFDKDNFFYKFFSKFMNPTKNRNIKDFVLRLKNKLFDRNTNIINEDPINVIREIRNYI